MRQSVWGEPPIVRAGYSAMRSMLAGASAADLRAHPYPHLRIENILPEDLCDALIRELPSVDTMLQGRRRKENARADCMLKDARRGIVSPLWREFMEAQASQEFLDDVLRLFAPFVRERYGHLAEGDHLRPMRAGVRYADTYETHDILLDALIGVNTRFTSSRPSSVRTAHIDHPRKLYAGLLYLRNPGDDSEGGAFTICTWKDSAHRRLANQQIAPNQVNEVTQIPYRRNTLVLFLNSLNSVHSVTPRQPTPHPRWFVNVLGECEQPLFDIRALQEGDIRRLARKALKKVSLSIDGTEVRN